VFVAKQRFSINVTDATNAHETIEEMMDLSFSIRPVSCLWVCLYFRLSLVDDGLLITLARQRRFKSKSKLYYDRRSVVQSALVSGPHLG
jgi:hypothetical protein